MLHLFIDKRAETHTWDACILLCIKWEAIFTLKAKRTFQEQQVDAAVIQINHPKVRNQTLWFSNYDCNATLTILLWFYPSWSWKEKKICVRWWYCSKAFLGSAMLFSFLCWNRWDQRQQKILSIVEADATKLIFTLRAFKFALQLILFSEEGENTSL